MSNVDDAKGRAKEAAGSLTNNSDLKREGKADQAAGKAEQAVDDATDKVTGAAEGVKDKIKRH
ncbi:MAG: CsbD family protein [Acidimicrobiales bacterium]